MVTGNTYKIVSGPVSSGCQAKCVNATSYSSCFNLGTTLSDYFVNLPIDPAGVTASHSGYSVTLMSNGMTVFEACAAENSTIKVSR